MIHHRITPTIALTLVLTAIAAAPASASSLRGLPAVAALGSGSSQRASTGPCGDRCSGHGYGPVGVSTRTIPSVRPFAAAAPSGGFDWGDAGIGAGVGFALAMIGIGGVRATARGRGRHTRRPFGKRIERTTT
jgi:hypothetical protein